MAPVLSSVELDLCLKIFAHISSENSSARTLTHIHYFIRWINLTSFLHTPHHPTTLVIPLARPLYTQQEEEKWGGGEAAATANKFSFGKSGKYFCGVAGAPVSCFTATGHEIGYWWSLAQYFSVGPGGEMRPTFLLCYVGSAVEFGVHGRVAKGGPGSGRG